ncbi:hypothetical protein [Roseiarcus sp.]|uniref:hypothetical protein n=1 Tax=Roseiarcus sp. TaxID=1969460 RepID=UPI003F950B72
MRSLQSDVLWPVDRPSTLSELDALNEHESLVTMGVAGHIGLLLLIVFCFAIAAQLLVGAPQ